MCEEFSTRNTLKAKHFVFLSLVKSVMLGCHNHQGSTCQADLSSCLSISFFPSPPQSVACVNPQMHPVWLCILSSHSDLRKHIEMHRRAKPMPWPRANVVFGQGCIWPPFSPPPTCHLCHPPSLPPSLSLPFLRSHSSLSLPRPVSSTGAELLISNGQFLPLAGWSNSCPSGWGGELATNINWITNFHKRTKGYLRKNKINL